MSPRRLPVVAIVGRPNVGKSTLFNRILGRRKALVQDRPGVTRDRNYGEAEHQGRAFTLVDTGGYEPDPSSDLFSATRSQVERALEEAELVIFLVDRKAGLTPQDREIAELLRPSRRPVLLAVNKVDVDQHEAELGEFWALGFERLFPLSAEHGRGVGPLLDAALELLPEPAEEDEAEEDGSPPEIRIAIIGRPNVGKSTLANRLCGEERHLVLDVPGTTVDAVDTVFEHGGRRFRLVDTAGVRRRARIRDSLESRAASLAIRTIERCHVSLLVLDATQPPGAQDARLARLVVDRGRALVLVANRWDLVRGRPGFRREDYEEQVREALPHVYWAPVVPTSALTGWGVDRLLDEVERVFTNFDSRVPTPRLNRLLERVERENPPPQRYHHPVRIHYASQQRVRPPTLVFYTNTPEGIGEAYRRYLEKRLRAAFGFEGTPLRLQFRRKRRLGEPRQRG